MSLNIYLFFDDNCAEAFEFYKSVFGGEFSDFSTFGEGPPDMDIPDDEKDRVMHVSLPIGSTTLMGSDACTAFGPPRTPGTNFAVSYDSGSRAEADRVFAALLDGGNVSMPLDEMFWGAYFGQGVDRFGIEWMFSAE